MDEPILTTPQPEGELAALILQANDVYTAHFDGDVWFGRCIFLSFYCDRGTCTFCFRSTQKHLISHPDKARRSLPSIIAEAMMIKAFGWRIEFLTGGYGILDDAELLRTIQLVSQILDEKIWINLGEVSTSLLEELTPYVEGIVSSIETVEEQLHKEVCPDKPIAPYIDMIAQGHRLGFKQSMTIVIGLGEKKEDFALLERFIRTNNISRITIYALRPVAGTPFTKGPDPLTVAWWIAKTRIAFPTLEIIAGSAAYRIPEISLFLRAGANAITKLPATTIFNTPKGQAVCDEVRKANRTFTSLFTCKDVSSLTDWDAMLEKTDLTASEKEQVRITLQRYLDNLQKKGDAFFSS
jgi:biotin synthase-like enzyme